MTSQSSNQMNASFHGSRPVGQIRQISYSYPLEKNFGKRQVTGIGHNVALYVYVYCTFIGNHCNFSICAINVQPNLQLITAIRVIPNGFMLHQTLQDILIIFVRRNHYIRYFVYYLKTLKDIKNKS